MGKVSITHPEQWTAYIAIIQLGTLLAVVFYFFKDILNILKAFVSENFVHPKKFSTQSPESRLGWLILIGTVPIGAAGLIFKSLIEGRLTKNLLLIAASLIFFALLLGLSDLLSRQQKTIRNMSWFDALIVGLGQVFALIPGASRSGTTITAGLFMGVKRDSAARFSFLLSLPAVLTSGLFEFKESLGYITRDLLLTYVIGIVFSFFSGYLAIDFLIKFLKTRRTTVFVVYRILLGAGIILFILIT
jgi:undecaprenyl-diphosphatase